MLINESDLMNLDQIQRVNIVNSITGIKPANLIGTKSSRGDSNLAIFSSVVHLGSRPALIGLLSRPSQGKKRDTLRNILSTRFYTINHVETDMIARAHSTSAKFDEGISEFSACGFAEEQIGDFYAPFVKSSKVKIGMELVDEIKIEANRTTFVIGRVKLISIADEIVEKRGHLNLETGRSAGISGCNTYYSLEKLKKFPYARPDDIDKIISEFGS
ncbi:MAG: flavin oxidoreductase [Pyrinomonadaceae bacterium]|nr:flavin oxidoreductase [Pyrinomonadaceae bacterium]